MFETSFGVSEIALVAVVALVVLGPEKMLGAVRTAGQWWGRLQGFASQARAELSSQMSSSEFSDLKKDLEDTAQSFKSEMESAAGDFKQSVEETAGSLESKASEIGADFQKEIDSASAAVNSRQGMEAAFDAAADGGLSPDSAELVAGYASDTPPELESTVNTRFEKRYLPGRNWDDLTEQICRIEDRLGRSKVPAMRKRSRYAARARVARTRIYR